MVFPKSYVVFSTSRKHIAAAHVAVHGFYGKNSVRRNHFSAHK